MDGDLKDGSFLQIVVPNLIGISVDVVTPEAIAAVTLPGLPANLLDTIFSFYERMNDQDYFNVDVDNAQTTLAKDIIAAFEDIAVVDAKLTDVSAVANDAQAAVSDAMVAIAAESESRGILEQQINVSFQNTDAQFLTQTQLIAQESQARASAVQNINLSLNEAFVAIQAAQDAVINESEARASDVQTIALSLGNAFVGIQEAKDAVIDEAQARASLATAISTQFDDLDSTFLRTTELFTSAGAASASDLQALQVQVGDSPVAAQIADFKNTQIGYEDEEGDWVEGAAFAQAFTNVKITGELGSELGIYQYFEAVENKLGEVEGQIQLAIDVDGKLTGIFISGSETQSDLVFASATTRFVNLDGEISLGLNTTTGELEFFGAGIFTGKLRSAKIELIGTTIMEITDPDGFGPDNLYFWAGPRVLDGSGDPDFAQLTKANADEWKDLAGNRYYGGGLSAGILRNAARSTTKDLLPSVELGPFGTNGNSKTIVVSLNLNASDTSPGACGTGLQQPDATVSIERSFNGSTWTSLQIVNFSGTTTGNYDSEFNHCETNENLAASYTMSDNNTATTDFYYRAVVTAQNRYHTTQNVNSQILSLIVTEV